jgi:hypothetical protein
MGALALAGCGGDDDTGNLVGHWQNISGEGTENEYIADIRITGDTVVFDGNYEATIENKPNFEAGYGVLIVKFTKYWTSDYTNWPEVTTVEDPGKVGKCSALYWKDLTNSHVSLADAYIGYDHAIVDDLATATTRFTNDAVADYVDWSITSPYNKK